jgi:hypothetical protein
MRCRLLSGWRQRRGERERTVVLQLKLELVG